MVGDISKYKANSSLKYIEEMTMSKKHHKLTYEEVNSSLKDRDLKASSKRLSPRTKDEERFDSSSVVSVVF